MELILVFTEVLFIVGGIVHCYTDYKEMLLYDGISLIMLLAGIAHGMCLEDWRFMALGAVAAGGIFLGLYWLCPQGVGFGDVELAFVLGTWLGWEKGLLSLLVALWLGFVVGMALLVFKRKGKRDAIPFGPCMCCSGVFMLYYGNALLAWYKGLF